ncbi:hypothetical protein OHC33_010899 [Knufia fluminis]|uniref:Uncharacterized protein n=1 Tax=Knufia fluminis TaxID=191047 RepID=A0AAN8EMI4_9EURO|nr:hypothetical protein OHC33_010899 [Knufia fluminis]
MSAPSKKIVIVTGGASGIGLAMTRHFACQGHDIAVLDVNEIQGPSIVSEIANQYPESELLFEKCDVSSWQDQAAVFKKIFGHYGRIDIVMANAGISERGRSDVTVLDEEEPSQPRLATISVNFLGVLNTVKLAAHYMNKKPSSPDVSRGLIICTASNAGLYPFPIAPVYAATKAAVIGLVRSLARPYAEANIQINALAPAVVETNIAPDRALFKDMIVTPFSTLTRGVDQFVDDSALTGAIAEIHGASVTIRPSLDVVDEDSAANLEVFWNLGYA